MDQEKVQKPKGVIISTYDDFYNYLDKCFDDSFMRYITETDNYGNKKQRKKYDELAFEEIVDRLKNISENKFDFTNELIYIPKAKGTTPEERIQSIEEFFINDLYPNMDDDIEMPIGCGINNTRDGISLMALVAFYSNYLAHMRKNDGKIRQAGASFNVKKIALKDLIATLYVYSKTEAKENEMFYWGLRNDEDGYKTFAIDLPIYGQFCLHFGNNKNKADTLKMAKDTAKTILEKK